MVCDDPRDRPAQIKEIEITPEMIDAGAEFFAAYDDSRVMETHRELAREVFQAMLSLARR